MPNRLPVLAVLLGLAGLIPFLACGAGAGALQGDWATRSLLGLPNAALAILAAGFAAAIIVETHANCRGLFAAGLHLAALAEHDRGELRARVGCSRARDGTEN